MSAALKVTASRLSDSRWVELKNLTSMRILSAIDSPAESFSAAFAQEQFPEAFGEIRAYDGPKILFTGKIDSQISSASKNGLTTRFEARSAGALLLDNQAYPCVMMNAQLSAIYRCFIEPYGFTIYGGGAGYIPTYTVRAGVSEWDALVGFSQRLYGVTPYVRGTQIMLRRSPSASPLVISNSGSGAKFSQIKSSRVPYNIVSQVILRDENGMYSVGVNNSAAKRTGARRKRYAVPGTEYAGNLALDANRRVRRSMFEYEEVQATLIGLVEAQPGGEALVRDNLLTKSNLMVAAREYIVDEGGEVTNVTLRSSIYYD